MKFKITIFLLALLYVPVLYSEERPVINKIEHQGLKKTKDSTVNYYMEHRTGNVYDPAKWETEKNSLMDLDIFADVNLDVRNTTDGTELVYSYKELPAYLIFPAMKRTDQDGLLLGPGIVLTNIFGEGIHQELLNRYTAAPEPFKAKEFLSYTRIPEMAFFPCTTEITVNYFKSYNSLKLYNENSAYAEGSIVYRLGRVFKLKGSGSALTVKDDNNAPFFNSGGKSTKMFMGGGDRDFLPSLGAGFIVDTRERMMNPHYGFYNEFKASVYGETLGGDGSYKEFLYDFRGYIPAGNSHIFHANLLAQYRPGVIPGYELYHIGGINSMRAYEPDPSVCGQHEVLWTVEYRYEVFANRQISMLDMNAYYGLQFVLGMDNALYWFPEEKMSQGKYLNSFFAGIHLLVPALERVRLEFGFHGPYRNENEIRFGINFGWYEKGSTQRNRVR